MSRLKTLLLEIFTWWNGQTLGTRFWTWRKGEFVGEDEFGNRYYRARNTPLGERRWVIYNGPAEASAIPAGWHGWMHHTVDTPPTEVDIVVPDWHLPHRPNMTGTPQAYRPRGSVLNRGRRDTSAGTYQPWTPGG